MVTRIRTGRIVASTPTYYEGRLGGPVTTPILVLCRVGKRDELAGVHEAKDALLPSRFMTVRLVATRMVLIPPRRIRSTKPAQETLDPLAPSSAKVLTTDMVMTTTSKHKSIPCINPSKTRSSLPNPRQRPPP